MIRKTILTSVAISVGAGVIASVSYHAGKIVGALEFGLGMLAGMKATKDNKDQPK